MTQAYPLSWPAGLPRTERRQASQFKTGLAGALGNVKHSLRLFGVDTGKPVSGVILSSNVSLGNDRPADPGIAAWFVWEGEQRCIAVDRYTKPEENLQAIHHILEARRTEHRHGGLHIVRQTFKGFVALPAQEGASASCWQILGIKTMSTNRAEIEAAFRQKARTAHPDAGGNHEAMTRLTAARDDAMKFAV